MTQTITRSTTNILKAQSLGLNIPERKRTIGIISYNDSTGRLVQCEVTAPFWENTSTCPDTAEMIKYLFSKGYGMIRYSTLAYNSLV